MASYSILEQVLFPPTRLNTKKLSTFLQHKTILITGASYGIGEAVALLLAEFEVHLILVARSHSKLKALQGIISQKGAMVSFYPTDLTQEAAVQQLIDDLKGLSHGLDIVISNAGHSIRRSIDQSLDRFHDFQRTMGINYFGPVQLLLGVIPILKKTEGHIINISAVNVLLLPAPYWAAYQASKTAFDQWFRAAAPELSLSKIHCSSLYLPLVRTRMIAPTKIYNKFPAMSPQHVAKIVGQLIYTQRKKSAPWWLFFGQLGSILFRSSWEFLLPFFLKKR